MDRISVSVREQQLNQIDELTDNSDEPRAQVVRDLIDKGLQYDEDVNKRDTRIDELEMENDELRNQVESLEEKRDELASKLSDLEVERNKLRERVQNLKERQALEERIEDRDDELAKISKEALDWSRAGILTRAKWRLFGKDD